VRQPHRQSLEERRLELTERSTAQRAALAGSFAPLAAKAAALDRATAAVRSHPLLAAGVAAAVAVLGGRKVFGLVARGVTLFALLRKL
jgi:hypothetical protein